MVISSVKAVPICRVKKHNAKKERMKKRKVFPPVKHKQRVNKRTAETELKEREREGTSVGSLLCHGLCLRRFRFQFGKPASSSGRWQRYSFECRKNSGSTQFCFLQLHPLYRVTMATESQYRFSEEGLAPPTRYHSKIT